MRAVGGRLAACDPDAAHALRRSIAEVVGDPLDARATALALRAHNGEHCIAHVLPLATCARRHAGTRCAAVAAVLVHKAALAFSHPPDAIAGLYGLTPGETRVLLAIVEEGGVRETAQALGISEATVKTHLHRVLGKTGATRQADLVKLVAGFANPMVGAHAALPCHRTAAADRWTQRDRTTLSWRIRCGPRRRPVVPTMATPQV
jgi:DNA-binding CsgD family transcriptional regulator